MRQLSSTLYLFLALGLPVGAAPPVPAVPATPAPSPPGRTYRVPYRLTATKHLLVRAKLHGKGPFNFILDTGAPALFISPEAAKKAGLKADEEGWATVKRLEIEGGAVVEKQEARVQEPPQLTGMNLVGLPGARLDGVLGYNLIARFRMEIDLTRPVMVWTPLKYQPLPLVSITELPEPGAPASKPPAGNSAPPETPGEPPAELAAMEKLPGLLGTLVPKRAEIPQVARGFLGFELASAPGIPRITRVLPQSPAARAKLAVGDRITHLALLGKTAQPVKSVEELQTLATQVAAGEAVRLTVLRGKRKLAVVVRAGNGF